GFRSTEALRPPPRRCVILDRHAGILRRAAMTATDPSTDHPTDRPIDRWFDSYSADHRNHANQRIHVVAVPAILWSVIALLWCIPVPPESGFRSGLWAGLACFAAWMFYFRASRAIGFGMLAVFVAMLWLTFWIERLQGTSFLLW